MSLFVPESNALIQNDVFDSDILIEHFIANIDVKLNSKKTYKRQIRPFIDWIIQKYGIDDLRRLTQQDIIAYRGSLEKSGKTSNTISGYITVVRKLFEWLESQKIFPNIAKNVKGPQKPQRFSKECLTIDQIKAAFAVFDTSTLEGLRDFALFNLLVRTGLRSVEVVRATVGDLRQEDGEAVLLVHGKGRDAKDDRVVLLDETLRPLRKYLAARGPLSKNAPLFCSTSNRSRGGSLKERTISGIIKSTLRKIDIDDSRLSCHSLRHTAVSLSIKNGATLIQAQHMARHSDPKTTMIYFHNHDRIKNAAERFIII